MNEAATIEASPALSEDEKARLHLWAQASPGQRLAWLEETLRLAVNRAGEDASRN